MVVPVSRTFMIGQIFQLGGAFLLAQLLNGLGGRCWLMFSFCSHLVRCWSR